MSLNNKAFFFIFLVLGFYNSVALGNLSCGSLLTEKVDMPEQKENIADIDFNITSLTPYFFVLGSSSFDLVQNGPLFKKKNSGRGKFAFNRKHFDHFGNLVSPLFSEHSEGGIIVDSLAEAQALAAHLNAHFFEHDFDVFSNKEKEPLNDEELEANRFLIVPREYADQINWSRKGLYIQILVEPESLSLSRLSSFFLESEESKKEVLVFQDPQISEGFFEEFSGLSLRLQKGYPKKPGEYPLDQRAVFLGTQSRERVLRQSFSTPGAQINHYSFAEARAAAIAAGVRNRVQLDDWIRSGEAPYAFPRSYADVYKGQWKGIIDFLGEAYIRKQVAPKLSYQKAKAKVQEQNFESIGEMHDWIRSERPEGFPVDPASYYPDWEGYPEFIGYAKRRRGAKKYSYAEAKQVAQRAGIGSYEELSKKASAGELGEMFPNDPYGYYYGEWEGADVFLSLHKRKAAKDHGKYSYEEAKKVARKKRIKTLKELNEQASKGRLGAKFPKDPAVFYKQEWEGVKAFLGTSRMDKWMSEEEAVAYIKSLGLSSKAEFDEWKHTRARPKNFPKSPKEVYYPTWPSAKELFGN